MKQSSGNKIRCLLCTTGFCSEVLNTEEKYCESCNATWRAQAVMRGVLTGLGYPENVDINEISTDLSRIGLGIGDDWKLARMLSQKFAYTNSFLNKFPILDLLHPPSSCIEYFEFITCSDVLEHTQPPRKEPITGLFQMLKQGGFAVISVPTRENVAYQEYYPDLVGWSVVDGVVHWNDLQGNSFVDENPEFHGGDGLTLAFRQWSRDQLDEDLKSEGFSQLQFLPNLNFKYSRNDIELVIARKA